MCLLSTRWRKMTLGRFRGSAIWKCELSIEKSFVRELTECYMLRPFAHPVAYCVLLGVVAQSLKPVKLSKLLAPCKRRNIVRQRCWELLRLFERSLRFLSPQSLNFSNPQSLQYSITSEPPTGRCFACISPMLALKRFKGKQFQQNLNNTVVFSSSSKVAGN